MRRFITVYVTKEFRNLFFKKNGILKFEEYKMWKVFCMVMFSIFRFPVVHNQHLNFHLGKPNNHIKKLYFYIRFTDSAAAGGGGGGRREGQETWNLCGHLWWRPSFLWLIFAGEEGRGWPPWPLRICRCRSSCCNGFKRYTRFWASWSSLGITNGNRSHNKPLELI